MRPPLTDDEVRLLGAGDHEWSLSSRLDLSDGEARGDTEGRLEDYEQLSLMNFVGQPSRAADVAAAAALRIDVSVLEANQRVLVVSAPQDAAPRFLALYDNQLSDLPVDRDDPSTTYVDLLGIRAAAVVVDDGDMLVIVPSLQNDAADFFLGVGRPLQLDEDAAIVAPVEDWLADAEDPWLADLVRLRASVSDPWEQVVAAGLYARLYGASAASEAAMLAAILAGAPPPELVRAPRWARTLDAAQIATLKRLTLAEIGMLADRFALLDEEWEPGDGEMRAELVELCQRRDDVECVIQLLFDGAAAFAFEDAIELLDEQGSRFLVSIPERLEVVDERLSRVRRADPACWWASIAVAPRHGE